MAEKLEPRDSESSWVLAGSEGLPIDTVGPEQDSTSHGSENEEPEEEEDEDTQDTVTAMATNSTTTFPSRTLSPEGSRQGDPEECEDSRMSAVTALDGSAVPSMLESSKQEPNAEAEPQPCPDTPQAGPTMEDVCCTGSDNDMEGLRWRQGHKPHPGPPTVTPTPHQGTSDAGEDELNMSKYLLGALALVAVGLLIITGGIYDMAEGPVESVGSWDLAAGEQELLLSVDSNDSQQKAPLPDAGGPQSVQSMSQLLDKLAKENQEIRLMQAELQAHKEDLQTLLHRSEGEAAAAGAQQQSLAAENAQLRAALEREVTALREAQAELRRLQATGAPGSPREPTAEQPRATGAPVRGKAAARRHGSLDSLWQELADTLHRARGSGDFKGLVEELSTLEQHLAQVLEAEGLGSFPTPWKKPFKVEKGSRWHKQHGARGYPHEQERREHGKPHHQERREHGKPHEQERREHGKPHDHERREHGKPHEQERREYGKPHEQERREYGKPHEQERREYGKPHEQERREYGKPHEQERREHGKPHEQERREHGKPHEQERREHGKPHEQERREYGKPHRKDPQTPHEHKPGKAWGKLSHSHPQHGSRELPWLRRYRAPQGCFGVTDCAHKEGQEVLRAALEPVQKVQFLQLLESFMGQLGLGRHFERLAPQLDGVFRADGVFAHDRLRFVDFVDDVEDLLEEVAWQEWGDKEAVDGFEEYVLRHYSGASRNMQRQRAQRQHGMGG